MTGEVVLSPVEVAQAAGARGSGWLKTGDGPWKGTVTCPDGSELTVAQSATGWKVTDETASSTTGSDLGQLLGKVFKKHGAA